MWDFDGMNYFKREFVTIHLFQCFISIIRGLINYSYLAEYLKFLKFRNISYPGIFAVVAKYCTKSTLMQCLSEPSKNDWDYLLIRKSLPPNSPAYSARKYKNSKIKSQIRKKITTATAAPNYCVNYKSQDLIDVSVVFFSAVNLY